MLLVPKGWIANQENIQNNANAPHVKGRAATRVADHLGRQIRRWARHALYPVIGAVYLDGEAEIGEFDCCIGRFRRQ